MSFLETEFRGSLFDAGRPDFQIVVCVVVFFQVTVVVVVVVAAAAVVLLIPLNLKKKMKFIKNVQIFPTACSRHTPIRIEIII